MIKLLKNLGKKEAILAIICVILIVGQVWLELKMPDYMSAITVLVQSENSEMSEILKNGSYMIGCAIRKLNICGYCRIFGFNDFSQFFNES